MRGCLRRGLDGAGRRGSRIYPYRRRVEVGGAEVGARAELRRIVVAEGVGVERRVLVVVVVRLAVVLVERIVCHAPHSTVIFSVAELHYGPSISQARLRDGGDVRSPSTMQAAGGSLGVGSWMCWPAT